MNVMIGDISHDLDTDVKGVQTVITLFLLTMAILMIPCSKLTDRWGRKRCLIGGLALFAVGALLSAIAPGLGVLIVGNSLLEGVGTALLIPPVYILATLWFTDTTSRAWAFGAISGMGGVGAAAGPLIGGVIATWIDWRAAFIFQALVVAVIILLSRNLVDPLPADRPVRSTWWELSCPRSGCSSSCSASFRPAKQRTVRHLRGGRGIAPAGLLRLHPPAGAPRAEPLLSTGLFRNRVCNLALVTQNLQWLIMMGTSFVVSVYLQEVHGYSPIRTGVIFTAATAGILISSFGARRLAARYSQGGLIAVGFLAAVVGLVVMIPFVDTSQRAIAFLLGLFLFGLGVGVMLTPSVNVVQSSFPEERQGEISGLSRSVSNLGSSFGTAIAGTILVSAIATGTRSYVVAMVVIVGFALLGLLAALRLPRHAGQPETSTT